MIKYLAYAGVIIGCLLIGFGIYYLTRREAPPVVSQSTQTSTPSPTQTPEPLSATYAIVGETIYNKKTLTAFTTPNEFFVESGYRSFDGLVFDRQSRLPKGLRFVDGRPLTSQDYRNAEGR